MPSVRFVIGADVAERFPQTRIAMVVASTVDGTADWPEVSAAVRDLEERLASRRWHVHDEAGPEVGSWHAAYRAFGTNPRRMRPSVDALSRRLARTGRLPRVHPMVDAYNLVSVSSGVPAGAFDLDRLEQSTEDVTIRLARPGDRFTPLGEPDTVEQPGPGEVVYAQGSDVLTRHWNHRDCDRTKLTRATARAVFVLERVSAVAVGDDRLAAAERALVALLRPHAGAVSTALLDAAAPAAALPG
jgi:DNA/RNA-binding domain of Phe-tRNA-synthetase-like protein